MGLPPPYYRDQIVYGRPLRENLNTIDISRTTCLSTLSCERSLWTLRIKKWIIIFGQILVILAIVGHVVHRVFAAIELFTVFLFIYLFHHKMPAAFAITVIWYNHIYIGLKKWFSWNFLFNALLGKLFRVEIHLLVIDYYLVRDIN